MKEDISIGNIDEIIKQYQINYFKNLFSSDDSSFLKKPVDNEIEEYFQRYSISIYDSFDKKLTKLSQIIYQELYGIVF
jgi:pilus assembly protein CpaF